MGHKDGDGQLPATPPAKKNVGECAMDQSMRQKHRNPSFLPSHAGRLKDKISEEVGRDEGQTNFEDGRMHNNQNRL